MILRAFAAALFVVLTLSSSASAECAWVLWGRGTGEWVIYDSSPDFLTCRAREKRALNEIWDYVTKNGVPLESGDHLRAGKVEGRIIKTETICLPDGTDPRGPKGK